MNRRGRVQVGRCQLLQQADMFQSFTCTQPWKAIVDMSKDGPMNIDGAEEAKKMIKRWARHGSLRWVVCRHLGTSLHAI